MPGSLSVLCCGSGSLINGPPAGKLPGALGMQILIFPAKIKGSFSPSQRLVSRAGWHESNFKLQHLNIF